MNLYYSLRAAHSVDFSMFTISVCLQMVGVALGNLEHALK